MAHKFVFTGADCGGVLVLKITIWYYPHNYNISENEWLEGEMSFWNGPFFGSAGKEETENGHIQGLGEERSQLFCLSFGSVAVVLN